MVGDPSQDIAEPDLRVDVVQFGSDDPAVDRCGGAYAAAIRRGVIMPGIWEAK